jgi:aspartate/methionine/tyrosine aminotransferase
MRSLGSQRAKGIEFSGIRLVFERAQKISNVIRLELGEPDFDTPRHIKAAAVQALEHGETHYTPGAGTSELREEISRKLRSDNCLEYDPINQIAVTSGATNALGMAIMATVDPEDEVLIPDPGWPNYIGLVKAAQANATSYSLSERNRFKLDTEELKTKISKKTKAIVICSPNNPTGSVLTEKELQEVAGLAEANDLIVISDEVYEKIIYGEARHQSIGSLDGMSKRVITVNAFSKTYAMTGWRLGYAGGPSEIIRSMVKLNSVLNGCPSSVAQKAGVAALRGSQDCVKQMRDEYLRRRDYIVERLNRIPGLTCLVPEGSFYAFPRVKEIGLSSFDFSIAILEQAGVSTVPGSSFGASGEGYARISYANSLENIAEAMDRIDKAIRSGLKVPKA